MASRINISPHPPNQSVLSTPTDTASCAATVSLSIRVLPNSSFSLPPQSICSLYDDQHRILRCSCESVCPSSAQIFRFHRTTPTPLAAALLSLSVLVGGGRVGFVTCPPSRTSNSAAPLSMSVLPTEASHHLHTSPPTLLRAAAMVSVNHAPLICPRRRIDDAGGDALLL